MPEDERAVDDVDAAVSRGAGARERLGEGRDVILAEAIRLVGQEDDLGIASRDLREIDTRVAIGRVREDVSQPGAGEQVVGVGVAREAHPRILPDREERRARRTGPNGRSLRCPGERGAEGGDDRGTRLIRGAEVGEPLDLRERFGDGARVIDPGAEAALAQPAHVDLAVLLEVREDEVRAERRDRVDARVLRPADARAVGEFRGGMDAPVGDARDAIAEAQREQRLGHARNERDDARGARRNGDDLAGSVGIAAQAHDLVLTGRRSGNPTAMTAGPRDGALFCETRAPGRVNLIGEHTDYNDGLVLPLAIDRHCRVEAVRRTDRVLRIRSREQAEAVEIRLDGATPQRAWTDYPVGVAVALEQSGVQLSGADLTIASDVPPGGGLSSSAALEVAVAQALLALAGAARDPIEIARICQRAENEFVGARCGIMDQMASLAARAGHALLLDCRSLEVRHVALPQAVRIVVVDSGVRHALASGEYNRRREECERAVALLGEEHPGLRSLRDVAPGDLAAARRRLPDVLARRCRHVVTENARVEAMSRALESGRLDQVGALLSESHTSLARDYEVSCPELDALVRIARDAPGCVGARMTGGGFGGCTVNLVRAERIDAFLAAMAAGWEVETGGRPGIHVCVPSDGAATALQDDRPTRI